MFFDLKPLEVAKLTQEGHRARGKVCDGYAKSSEYLACFVAARTYCLRRWTHRFCDLL